MIDQGEIRRIAGSLGIDPGVIDHDYVLGCFLQFLSLEDEVRGHWGFKGGTALAKCHFTEYRFSEDLDFTCLEAITGEALLRTTDRAKMGMQDAVGVRTGGQATVIDVIRDDYGLESFEAGEIARFIGSAEVRDRARPLRHPVSFGCVCAYSGRPRCFCEEMGRQGNGCAKYRSRDYRTAKI